MQGQALPLIIGIIFGMLVFIASYIIMSTPTYSLAGLQPIDVQVGNKTYSLYYSFSNGGSIIEAKADSMQPYGGELYAYIKSPTNGYMDIVIPRELHDVIGFTDHHNLAVFVDDNAMYATILDNMTSCDQISFRIPIRANSESIDSALLGLNGEDPNNATITFNYDSGAKSIDITGTSAIPEFSSSSSLAIMAGITGIIVMAAKVRAWKS